MAHDISSLASSIPIHFYLILSGIVFSIGLMGILLNRRNLILILMSIELILLSININFVAFSTAFEDLAGQVFVLFILTVAAAEVAIGLAILVLYYRERHTLRVDDLSDLKG